MTREEALRMIPELLDQLEALDKEKSDWLSAWRERRDAIAHDLGYLRRIARGEETLEIQPEA